MTGSILRGIGSFYTVLCDEDGQEYTLRAQKKLRHQKMTPMVGDCVRFTPGQGEEDGWLEEILPRRSAMERPSVANVDMLMLVVASVSAGHAALRQADSACGKGRYDPRDLRQQD